MRQIDILHVTWKRQDEYDKILRLIPGESRELGEEDKCTEYFENHLGKAEETYEILVDYYKERDREKAVQIAHRRRAVKSAEVDAKFS